MDPVFVGGLLWLGGISLVVSVWKYAGDGLTVKIESNVWVAKKGT